MQTTIERLSLRTAGAPSPAAQEDSQATLAAQKLRDELEFIGYAISHDLRAPLRSIESCSDELALLSNETSRTLNAETSRLKTMLEGLLDYVRLETYVPATAALDASELAAAAIQALEPEIKTAGARVTYDSLPMVIGHRGRLTRLFLHLLDNALKFRGAAAPAIHISARRDGGVWKFCVADNGIGIAPEHHRTIFMLFQRLHTAEAYPGHGIGLGLSRKIVEAHGGRLWVESAPQAGSRFYFTLPAAD